MENIPRRIMMNKWIREEKIINDAMQVIEAAGAHPKLTEAVIKLQEAQAAVADWWDEILAKSEAQRLEDSPF